MVSKCRGSNAASNEVGVRERIIILAIGIARYLDDQTIKWAGFGKPHACVFVFKNDLYIFSCLPFCREGNYNVTFLLS